MKKDEFFDHSDFKKQFGNNQTNLGGGKSGNIEME